MKRSDFLTGLDVLAARPGLAASWGRVGLLCNQASVTSRLEPAWQVLRSILGERLVALFGPQHGIGGTEQYNMVETAHGVHPPTGLPVYSLYSETREPTRAMLEHLDTLVIDLQISGCRIYTWKATLAACLTAAARDKKRVVVLDRPNPLGGEIVEGRALDDDMRSFVGAVPTAMRHALTMGELARLINRKLQADLEVIALEGWDPRSLWPALGRSWVLTSPMLPTFDSVAVYPGLVLVEGTNLSEGRGTTLPFQLIGGPYVKDGRDVIARLKELDPELPGVHVREAVFVPLWNKWQGRPVAGVQLHVIDAAAVRSYRLALALIRAFKDVSTDEEGGFAWEKPGYEYDFERLPIDLLVGSAKASKKLSAKDFRVDDLFFSEGVSAYLQAASDILLYERQLRHEP